MRKVALWNQPSYEGNRGNPSGMKPKKLLEGWFHAWGSESCEDGTDSVAIVELEDGQVEMWCASRTQFIKVAPEDDNGDV